MKISIVNYSNKNYLEKRLALNGKSKLFDSIFSYSEEWLKSTPFYGENIEILSQKRGAGYWLWKPYILLHSMQFINGGDVLFYMDCGDTFIDSLYFFLRGYFLDDSNNHIFTIGGLQNKCWTKKDAFSLMSCDSEKYWNAPQLEAGIVGFRKTDFNISLIEEWLYFCRNSNILTDLPNISGNNFDCFVDHRHDQSILTNLQIKYNLSANSLLRKYVTCNV